jgi:hypothetical protein
MDDRNLQQAIEFAARWPNPRAPDWLLNPAPVIDPCGSGCWIKFTTISPKQNQSEFAF